MAAATPASKATADKATASKATTSRAPIGRAVIWIGLALGTAVTVLAVMHGIRIPRLEVVLSVIVTWALLIVLAVTVAELARRHHRTLAGHAWRHGKRGALFAGRHTGRGARWLWGRAASTAADRWGSREHRPLMFTRTSGPQPEPGPAGPAGRPPTRRMDGQPETEADTRFFDLRESGYTGPINQDGNPPEGTTTMADTTVTDDSTKGWDDPLPGPGTPGPGKARTRRPTGASYSAAWKQVVADTSEFEPEDDGHLLAWMAAEVNGMSAYAEAMTEVYETCVNTVGLDPVAMKATHDVADAAADAASAMAAARAKFAAHYSEVREFAASGGLLPYDGRWITGDGDA